MSPRPHRPGGEFLRPPLPPEEPQRLESLRSYEILDSPPEQAYDDLALLASQICDTPIALVSFIDEHRQWFKATIGVDLVETPRDLAFCAHAIAGQGTMVVPDVLADERFAQHPLATSEPKIRFYAGAPLRGERGHGLGTICVLDRIPHNMTAKQQVALEALSRQVMAQLELRRQLAEVKRMAGLLPYCTHCGKLRTDLGDTCVDCLCQ